MKSKSLIKNFGLSSIIQSGPGGQLIVNAFLSYVGLVMPGYLIAQSFYAFNVQPIEPRLYHFFIAIPCAGVFGALLYLLGVRGKQMGRFGIIMIFLFGYGFFINLIARSIFIIIAQTALYYFTSRENIALVTRAGAGLLHIFFITCALWNAFTTDLSETENDYSSSSTRQQATRDSPFETVAITASAYETFADDSSDSSDSDGGDSGSDD